MTDTRTLPTWALGAVQAKHAALTKIAEKLGVTGPGLIVGPTYRGLVPPAFLFVDERSYETNLVDVTTFGASPVLPGGWRVLAVVEHGPVANVVSCSPEGRDQGWAERLHGVDNTCDHCGFDRNRNRTILLVSEAGEVKRVGSTCLKDFLGYHGASLDNLWRLLRESNEDVDEDTYREARVQAGDPVLPLLAVAAAAIRQHGFVRSADWDRYPTVQRVRHALSFSTESRREADVTVTPEDEATASATLAWMLAYDGHNDYRVNLRSAALNDFVLSKQQPLVVSAPQSYLREQSKAAERAARESRPEAQPVPTGKVTVEGEVVKTEVMPDNGYGERFVMTVLLDNGSMVWGTVPGAISNVQRGDRVTFSATVTAKTTTFGTYKRPTQSVILTPATA